MKDPGKLLRLFREMNLLSSNKRGYTVQELADKLEVSYRTVYRDLRIFEATGFEILQNPLSKRVRLAHAQEISDKMSFNKTEAEVLQQALVSLPDGPVKQLLFDKVHALSSQQMHLQHLQRQQTVHNFQLLAQAMREKKQAVLLDYNSPSSQSIGNRLVEPFAFNDNMDTVYCFEPASKKNKLFKLERIGQVRLEQISWGYEHLHEQNNTDIFGLPIDQQAHEVKLILGRLSSNLLKEERPAALPFMSPLPDGNQLLQIRVADYRGIGRFVLGLIDDIEIVGPADFISYLQKQIQKLK
ncbi:MAG: helix-turn-helix transcriptional regulator [Bacteroidia bacterium]